MPAVYDVQDLQDSRATLRNAVLNSTPDANCAVCGITYSVALRCFSVQSGKKSIHTAIPCCTACHHDGLRLNKSQIDPGLLAAAVAAAGLCYVASCRTSSWLLYDLFRGSFVGTVTIIVFYLITSSNRCVNSIQTFLGDSLSHKLRDFVRPSFGIRDWSVLRLTIREAFPAGENSVPFDAIRSAQLQVPCGRTAFSKARLIRYLLYAAFSGAFVFLCLDILNHRGSVEVSAAMIAWLFAAVKGMSVGVVMAVTFRYRLPLSLSILMAIFGGIVPGTLLGIPACILDGSPIYLAPCLSILFSPTLLVAVVVSSIPRVRTALSNVFLADANG